MILNINQQRVYEWLSNDLRLPVFAEAYKGAVILKHQKSAGYISFVAHAGRDLMNSLASTVEGIKSGRVNYREHIENLQGDWREEWRITDELSPDLVEKGHLIPIEICQKIALLIEEHKSGSLRSSDADGLFFSTFLDYSDKDRVPRNFLTEWKNTKEWFLQHVHLRSKPFLAKTEKDLEKHFNCLENYLFIAASSQYERLKELNAILDSTNS